MSRRLPPYAVWFTLGLLFTTTALPAACCATESLEFGPTYSPVGAEKVYVRVSSRCRNLLGDSYTVVPLGYLEFDVRHRTARTVDHVEPGPFGPLFENRLYDRLECGELVVELIGEDGRPIDRFCQGWGLPAASSICRFAGDESGRPVLVFIAEHTRGRCTIGEFDVESHRGRTHDYQVPDDWLLWRFSAGSSQWCFLVLRQQRNTDPGWSMRTLRFDLETGEATLVASGSFSALDSRGNLIENYEDRGLETMDFPVDSRVRLIQEGRTRTISLGQAGSLPLERLIPLPTIGWVLLWYTGSDAPMLYNPLTADFITLSRSS